MSTKAFKEDKVSLIKEKIKYLIYKDKNQNFLKVPNLIYFKQIDYKLYLINVGNTHLLRIVDKFSSNYFKNDINNYPNCNISQVIIKDKFKIKTYERNES